ncbi:MAG: hypothetical protein ACK5Q5_20030 [Planctomycetaceae bacterium]
MRIQVEVSDEVTPAVRRYLNTTLPARRREAVEAALQDTLVAVIGQNPVETARSRAAWVSSLEQLGGTPPAGWQGLQPSGEADGRIAGQLSRQHEPDITAVSATNSVSYVGFLEYGTSRTSPFSMVRRALRQARQQTLDRLRQLFR